MNTRFWWGNLRVDGLNTQMDLKEWDGVAWAGLFVFRIETDGGIL